MERTRECCEGLTRTQALTATPADLLPIRVAPVVSSQEGSPGSAYVQRMSLLIYREFERLMKKRVHINPIPLYFLQSNYKWRQWSFGTSVGQVQSYLFLNYFSTVCIPFSRTHLSANQLFTSNWLYGPDWDPKIMLICFLSSFPFLSYSNSWSVGL